MLVKVIIIQCTLNTYMACHLNKTLCKPRKICKDTKNNSLNRTAENKNAMDMHLAEDKKRFMFHT